MDQELAAVTSPQPTQQRREDENSSDCVHFTEEQYKYITDMVQDLKFHCFIETSTKSKMSPASSFPKWQELTAGTGKSFALVIPAGWLGLLKYGLLSTCSSGAEELYCKVLSSYEGALDAGMKAGTVTHQEGGQFRSHLERGRARIVKETSTIETAKRKCHQLATEALHINRAHKPTCTGSTSCVGRLFTEPVKHLPSNEQADEEETYDLLEGCHSLGFKVEVARMMAYVAERMEEDGEEVDWEKLHWDITKQRNKHSTVIAAIGEALDRHILKEQSSLLGSSGASTMSAPVGSSGASTVSAPVAVTRTAKGRVGETLAGGDEETRRGMTRRGVKKTSNMEDEGKRLARKRPREETKSSRLCSSTESDPTGKVKGKRVEALAHEDRGSRRGTKSSKIGRETLPLRRVRSGETGREAGRPRDSEHAPAQKYPRMMRKTRAKASDQLAAILLTEELSSDSEVEFM